MSKIAKSLERNTFQKENYLKRCQEKGKEPNEAYIRMFEEANAENLAREADPAWKKDNLEYDLRTTDWILAKVKEDRYAQNLYAAMCNILWQRIDVFPILKDEYWSCSWRYAGGIIADMRQQGDYIDWYCSGIGAGLGNGDEDGVKGYVPEGTVTEEIEQDLKRLQWHWKEWQNTD
jgi:hypothetical protein